MTEELTVGSRAPDFRLASSQGGEAGSADYLGKAHVVLFFVREYL